MIWFKTNTFVYSYFWFCCCKKIGDRCLVEPGDRRGIVKFVGHADTLAPGFWIGIEYDEPLGKHDGMYVIT